MSGLSVLVLARLVTARSPARSHRKSLAVGPIISTALKTTVLILLLSASLFGCTTTRTIGWEDPSPLHALNSRATKRTATVTLADGLQVLAANLHMAADSTSWVSPRSGGLVTLATGEVVNVTFTSGGMGALQGAVLGIIIGGAVGAAGLAATWSPCRSTGFMSCFMHPDSRSEAALLGALSGGILGLPIGTLLGALSGSKNTYRIEAPAAPASIISEM
jgi:hypothetical protein